MKFFILTVFLKCITCMKLSVLSLQDPNNSRGVYLPQGYKKYNSPDHGQPLQIQTSLKIHDIANNDKLNSLVLESSITIQWNDPRLIFNENHDWNKYPYIKERKSLLNALWFPNLYFIGSQKSEDIEGVVSKLGEVRLYKNGTISYEDRIRLTIGSCESTFQNFPFDTKICKVRGIVYEEDADTLRISESQILFDPELFSTIPGFDIDIQYLDEENSVLFWKNRLFSVKGFDVKFYRRTLSYIFYYIAPNQLIVSFTWLSFLIPLENIPGRLGILLVSMLLIRDYPYSFTSDYTALGIWSLLCRLQIMICIIGYMIIIKLNSKLEVEDASPQYTTNTTQRNGGLIRFSTIENESFDKRAKMDQIIYKIENKGIVLLPLLSVFVNIGFWIHFLVASK